MLCILIGVGIESGHWISFVTRRNLMTWQLYGGEIRGQGAKISTLSPSLSQKVVPEDLSSYTYSHICKYKTSVCTFIALHNDQNSMVLDKSFPALKLKDLKKQYSVFLCEIRMLRASLFERYHAMNSSEVFGRRSGRVNPFKAWDAPYLAFCHDSSEKLLDHRISYYFVEEEEALSIWRIG